MGKMATSPLPPRGSPPLESGLTKSEVAHLRAKWLPYPCRFGDPHRLRARGTKSEVAHLWAKWLPHPCRLGDPHRFRAGGQNQKWPTCGQNGYLTPSVPGIPTASQRGDKIRSGPLVGKVATSPVPSRGSPPLHSGGTKSEVAPLWARWLRRPCRLGDPHRFRAGGRKSQGAHLWAKWLPLGDPHRFRAGGQNQKWPTCRQNGYLTRSVSGIPTASQRGGKIRSGPLVGKVATSPLPSRGSPPLHSGGAKITRGPLVGKMATSPLPSRGSPPLESGGTKSEVAHLWAKWLPHPFRSGDPRGFRAGVQNQKWPTCGQGGYITPAVSGIPIASQRGDKIRSGPLVGKMATSPLASRGSPPLHSGGTKSEVAHLWARWLRHPCRLGDPHQFRAGGQNQKCPLVGKMATSPLPFRGSPGLQSGGTKSEVAHLWARWLHHPCRLGDPHRFTAGGQNHKGPTCGQNGYLTPGVSGIPTASQRGDKIRSGPLVGKMATSPLPARGSPPIQSGGTKSEGAHLWARWLPHPCHLGDPHRLRAG